MLQPKFIYEQELKGTVNAIERKRNQYRKIVSHLYYNGAVSIADIVSATKMSQPLVASLVDDLIKFGIVTDSGIGASVGGRRPNLYSIYPDYQYVIGAEINQSSMSIAIFNLDNQLEYREEFKDLDLQEETEYCKVLIEKIGEALHKKKIKNDKILAVGISIPGLVDAESGITYSYLTSFSHGVSKYLQGELKMPVFIDNDARVMTLGEKAFGKAKSKKNVLCLNLSNGIGLGMILNGELHAGKNGFAGEFGHILIDPVGKLCYCGKMGCLETLTSGKILVDQIVEAVENGQETFLAQCVTEGRKIDLETVVKAILAGDQFAINQLNEMCDYLGKGLVILIHLLNPEMIIIGGELARAGKFIVNPVSMAISKYAMDRISSETELVTTDLFENAILLGNIANVMQKILSVD